MFKRLLVQRTQHSFIQLIRYVVVVLVTAPIDLGGYILLKASFHINIVVAATISFTSSLIVNYILSILWVWTARSASKRHLEATLFAVIGLVGLGLTDLIVWYFTNHLGLNYIVAKLIAFSIVFFWNFGARHFLFRKLLQSIESKD